MKGVGRIVKGSQVGAVYLGNGQCRFRLWAPTANKAAVRILSPVERTVELEPSDKGYFQALVQGVEPGSLYLFQLDGSRELPDPASRSQPQGVHGRSRVEDPSFPWDDQAWEGLPLNRYILYEVHVGTFTEEGTFEAILPHLDFLKDLGVTALELMPVAQFPGERNWGYDGVYPFAVQDSYGGAEGLKGLVNACHLRGLAVVLDVVYNHLGPEGNYLGAYGPYFTDRYKTPWSEAVNLDGPYSDEVRRFFTENALYWIQEFHVDALRLDAVHAVFDFSASPFLKELAQDVKTVARRLKRRVHLIAESALNDSCLIRSSECGGLGLDALWNEDFHHALHALLTGEREGYYQDYGRVEHLAKAFQEGFVYTGEYSSYRKKRHGSPSGDMPPQCFVVFSQNHDQVGNRMKGERLSSLISFEALKLAAGVILLSPFIPLLFMGEEYGEKAPFPYFISHGDPQLVEAVREGRRKEFEAFYWVGDPPDPQAEETFHCARIHRHDMNKENHRHLLELYRKLIHLRKRTASERPTREGIVVTSFEEEKLLFIQYPYDSGHQAMIFHFGLEPRPVTISLPRGTWKKQLDSSDECWAGPGSKVPGRIESSGEVSLVFSPTGFVLLSGV